MIRPYATSSARVKTRKRTGAGVSGARSRRSRFASLLDGDLRSGVLQLLGDRLGFVFGDPLLHRLGSALDERLRLGESERGDLADGLDDLDLLGASLLEDDVELGLLGGRRGRAGGRRGRHGDRRRGADAVLRFELL